MQDRPGPGTSPALLGPVLETSLYVADLDRSAGFYQGLFGLPCYLHDGRMVALGLPGPGVLLLFLDGATEEGSRGPAGFIPGHGARGRAHLCFRIEAAALEGWTRTLADRAIAVESRVVWPRGGTSLYFRDPDDHSVELATPGLWPNY